MNYQKQVEVISAKGLTENLINGSKVFNGAKYFFKHITKLLSIYTSQKTFSTEIYWNLFMEI